MTTYYISNAGSDANNGTSTATPFLTIAQARSVALQGDTLNLRYGDTFTEQTSFAVGVTIQPYGTSSLGRPKIHPPTSTPNSSVGDALTFTDCAGISLQSLEILGSTTTFAGTRTWQVVVLFTTGATLSNIIINNCYIHDCLGGVIVRSNFNTSAIFVTNVIYTNNVALNMTAREAIAIVGFVNAGGTSSINFSDVTITDNTVTNVFGVAVTSTYGIALEGANNVLCSRNTITGIGATWTPNGTSTVTGPFGIEMIAVTNSTITHNTIDSVSWVANINPGQGGGIGIAQDVAGVGNIIAYNYIARCKGSGYTVYGLSGNNSTLHHNVIAGCATIGTGGSIDLRNVSVAGITCHSNTVISSGPNPCINIVPATGTAKKIYNNIFVSASGIASVITSATSSLSMDGNYHQSGPGAFKATDNGTSYTSLAAWQAATGFETSGVSGALALAQSSPLPVLTAPTIDGAYVFSPTAGAPVINAGISLAGQGITPGADLLGIPWAHNSIGAIYNPWSILGPAPVGFSGGLSY